MRQRQHKVAGPCPEVHNSGAWRRGQQLEGCEEAFDLGPFSEASGIECSPHRLNGRSLWDPGWERNAAESHKMRIKLTRHLSPVNRRLVDYLKVSTFHGHFLAFASREKRKSFIDPLPLSSNPRFFHCANQLLPTSPRPPRTLPPLPESPVPCTMPGGFQPRSREGCR